MCVDYYELDHLVFQQLQTGKDELKQWQGAASGIADYVSSWGVERFWAMSRSPVLLGGGLPTATEGSEEQRRYFSWGVARVILCEIVGKDLNIKSDWETIDFQNRFRNLTFNQQVLLTDLLIEIAETIQFWTMRMKESTSV
jgi:hypothetical protein